MRKLIAGLLSVGVVLAVSSAGYAKETVVWWDFLGGGDGVRMKKLIDGLQRRA